MSKILRVAMVVTSITFAASMAQAQTVGMAGSYSEGNGIIVNIPQNPPLASCDPAKARCVGKRDLTPARLITGTTTFGATEMIPPPLTGTPMAVPYLRSGPQVGVLGARNITTPGVAQDALNVGGQFTVPPLAFTQRLGVQVGQVLNSSTKQLDTNFTAAMPGENREKNNGVDRSFYTVTAQGGRGIPTAMNPAFTPNLDTRVMAVRAFSVTNVNAHGQNNGLATTNPNYDYRANLNTTHTTVFDADDFRMSYTGGSGFSGTMTILLDGNGRLVIHSQGLSEAIDPGGANFLQPLVATNPVGDFIPGFNDRNAGGWNITAIGRQVQGRIKAFGPAAAAIPVPGGGFGIPNAGIQGVPCAGVAFSTTCNLIVGDFDISGATVAPLPKADSTKHMFAWTTGTVSHVVTGPRQGVIHTITQTGMGYDSVVGTVRNVGLVAGSYTRRTDGQGIENINTQMAGIDLKFTPEPGATVALISGLGLLGALGVRRRS